MRLLTLELEDWGCHERLKADLSQGLQIEGRNGTGKSSILSAVRFIFRETARGYAGKVRNGGRSARVSLRFTCDGREYVVEKKLYVDKPSTAQMIQDGVLVADNQSSVYARLGEMLSEDVLDKLLYIPQGGLTTILDQLSGRDGKVEMDRLFGLDRLERVWVAAQTDVTESEANELALEALTGKYPDNAEEAFKAKIADLTGSNDEGERKIKSISNELETLKQKLTAAETRLRSLQDAKRTLDQLKSEANKVKIEEASTSKELESLTQRLTQLNEKKTQLDALLSQQKGLVRYGLIRETLHQLNVVDGKLQAMSDIIPKRERLTQLHETLKAKPGAESSYNDLKKRLKTIEDEYAAVSADLRREAEFYAQLGTLETEAKCPRCGQKLNAFTVEKEKTESAYRIASTEEKRKALAAEVDEIKAAYASVESKVNSMRLGEAEAGNLTRELQEKEMQAVALLDSQQSLQATLTGAGYDGEPLDSIESKYNQLKRIEGNIQSLTSEVAEAQNVRSKISEAEERLHKVASRGAEIASKISSVTYSEDVAQSASMERDIVSDARFKAESNLKVAELSLKQTQSELKETREKLTDYVSLKENHAKAKRKTEVLKAARDVFHRDRGLVKYLRESFIRSLNATITSHFKRFNQNPRYVDVSFDRDYNLIFRTNAGDITLEQISGGERVQLALALRLALIDLMSPIRLLILDEPFGSLDEAHREMLGESLNKIAEQGQLILVTHVHVDSLQLPNRLDLGGY